MDIKVYQLDWSKLEDREMRLTITCDGNIAAMMIGLIEGKYTMVAEVNPESTEINSALEEVYMMTQNIESSWIKNDGVFATFDVLQKGGCKSSSVGDIFEVDGKLYGVDGCGFTELTLEKARAEKRAA
jgi:hypothetical protein